MERARRAVSRGAVASAAAFVVVFLAAEFLGDEPPRFRHGVHLEEGAACGDCHDTTSAERAVTLKPSACEDCHDEGAPAARLARRYRPLKLPFRHQLHAEAQECVDCHAAIATDASAPGAPVLAVARCFACHEENDVETAKSDCASCHGSDLRGVRPAGHDPSWGDTHGRRAKAGLPSAHGRRCGQCHADEWCMGCHQQKKAMSHRLHLEEREAECDQCHASTEGDAAPGVAGDSCADCHEGDVQVTRVRAPARPLAASFPHALHAESLECGDCHAQTLKDAHPAGEPIATQPRCAACHEENEVAIAEAACGRCHAGDRRRTAPASHRVAWQKRHGEEAAWSPQAGHGRDCSQCHARSACDQCHADTRPRSHTGLWRSRLHGRAAEWSRESCRTCHETGACASCHRQTAPSSHRGAFRATHGLMVDSRADERCAVCHTPSWCAACHQGR